MYKFFFKPLADRIIGFIGFLLLSPLFLLVTLLLSYYNNGKVFFYQFRPGKDEEIFKIIKFKTMTDETNDKGELLPDERRLTVFGKFVRKFSIDEIPQLINVLKGEMSLIGPRPLLPEYISLYTEHEKRRHEVKPGITGWAQVNGRNAISWKKKLALDVHYVDNLSFILDLKILYLTILKVIKSEGINPDNKTSTEPFNGNN